MEVKCRPFYLQRDVPAIVVMAVYLPPQANDKLELEKLHSIINTQLNACPDGALIVAGDSNRADMKTVLPRLHKNLYFLTRDKNILHHPSTLAHLITSP